MRRSSIRGVVVAAMATAVLATTACSGAKTVTCEDGRVLPAGSYMGTEEDGDKRYGDKGQVRYEVEPDGTVDCKSSHGHGSGHKKPKAPKTPSTAQTASATPKASQPATPTKSAKPASAQPTPVEKAPVEKAPVEKAPVEKAPVEKAPKPKR